MNKIIAAFTMATVLLLQGCAEETVEVTCTIENLLVNGDFENVPSGWAELQSVIGAYGNPAPSSTGANYARFLNDQSNARYRISQIVHIPDGIANLYFSGYRDFISVDPEAGSDTLTIRLTPNGGSEEIVDVLDNLDTTTGWVGFSYGLSQNYAGQNITVEIEAESDALAASTFYLDDLALEAETCL